MDDFASLSTEDRISRYRQLARDAERQASIAASAAARDSFHRLADGWSALASTLVQHRGAQATDDGAK
jgi:hypothetical protein